MLWNKLLDFIDSDWPKPYWFRLTLTPLIQVDLNQTAYSTAGAPDYGKIRGSSIVIIIILIIIKHWFGKISIYGILLSKVDPFFYCSAQN